MNKSATDKITKAKIQLLIKEPFFATLALSIKYEECSEIKTADIDGVTMRYNPNFIEKLSI
jgi:predicted metal-dependent peptidase